VESTQGNGEASIGHRAMTVVADQPAGGLPEFRLRRVTRYVQDNLHRELRLAELSGLVHMSPYHFARLFKRSTGVSPHRFLVRRRIEQASALLAAQTLSIAEIARSVGFRTPSHFTTTFRRVTGITPSVYRCSTLCAISRQSLPAASVVGTVASFCSRATTSRYVASKCVASCRGPSSRIAAFGPGSLDDPVRPPGRPKNFSERISPRQRLVTIVSRTLGAIIGHRPRKEPDGHRFSTKKPPSDHASGLGRSYAPGRDGNQTASQCAGG